MSAHGREARLFETPVPPIASTRPSADRVGTPRTPRSRCAGRRAGSGLLDDRRQGLLGGPARLREGREVGALARLRDGRPDPAGAGLPAALAAAVPAVGPARAPRPGRGAGGLLDPGRHRPLTGVG